MSDRPRSAQATAAEALLRANEALALNQETNRLVKEMHQALMQPLPGYDRSFMARASEVVIKAEAGKIVGDRLITAAKWTTAIGTIATAFYAALRFGHAPKG